MKYLPLNFDGAEVYSSIRTIQVLQNCTKVLYWSTCTWLHSTIVNMMKLNKNTRIVVLTNVTKVKDIWMFAAVSETEGAAHRGKRIGIRAWWILDSACKNSSKDTVTMSKKENNKKTLSQHFLNRSSPAISLWAVFCYVWELYWDLASPRSSSSPGTVCRSDSGFVCVPGFSVGLRGHLVKTEKRELNVLDTVTQQFLSSWIEASCGMI